MSMAPAPLCALSPLSLSPVGVPARSPKAALSLTGSIRLVRLAAHGMICLLCLVFFFMSMDLLLHNL